MWNHVKGSIRSLTPNTVATFAWRHWGIPRRTSSYCVSWRIIEPGSSRLQVRSITASARLLSRSLDWCHPQMGPIYCRSLLPPGGRRLRTFLKKSREQRQKCVKFVAPSHQVFLVLIRRIPVYAIPTKRNHVECHRDLTEAIPFVLDSQFTERCGSAPSCMKCSPS